MKWVFFLVFFGLDANSKEYFVEWTDLQFKHVNGLTGEYYYPEIVGSGVAVFDFENDGDMDIYFVQSGDFENNSHADELWINQLDTGKLAFKKRPDLTRKNIGYGIAVASADINNDGFVDLVISNLGDNFLLINQSGKYFKKIILPSIETSSFSASASFCDINNDGWLDLYISNYVNWSRQNNPVCYANNTQRDYCGPAAFKGQKDDFFLNNHGNLVLSNTTMFATMSAAPGLGVICRDFNADGWNDFVVANDGSKNFYWQNQQGKQFKEKGLVSGLAVNGQGVPEASMGIAVADYDLDGDFDVFFTHLKGETNTLLQNNGKAQFFDSSNRSDLAAMSFAMTGWGTGFLQVNNDIYPDLLSFNGAVAKLNGDDSNYPLSQSNQLYLQGEGLSFKLADVNLLQKKNVSRGAAFTDLDNDGDMDVVVSNNLGKSQILLNQMNPEKWFGLRFGESLQKIKKLTLKSENQKFQKVISLATDGSYASASDSRLLLNESEAKRFSHMEIIFMDGTVKIIATNINNTYHLIP